MGTVLDSSLIEGELVLDLKNVSKDMIEVVGGKAANLGELLSLGIRVPPGFVITSNAFRYFLKYNGLYDVIKNIFENDKDEKKVSEKVKSLILNAEIPPDLKKAISDAYEQLEKISNKEVLVAVRSSATVEDIEEAS